MAISLSGSLEITGSINATGGITGSFSGTATSASYALVATSASYANNATTSSYALVATSASYAANSDLLDGRDSLTFANTGSNSFVGSQNINGAVAITGSLTTTGAITAQTLNVQQVTSSIVYSSGSNIFGNSISNTQSMTGSVGISGSLNVNGVSTLQGALTGTSATFSGNVIFDTTDRGIVSNTSDGSDNKFVSINGGGARGSDRGAGINLFGNEAAGTGRIDVNAGDVTGGVINLVTAGLNRLTVNRDGSTTLSGALSGTSATFSGLITTTNTSTVFYASGATTLSKYIRISNTSGDFFAGVETSTGGNIIVGAAAYSGAIAAANGLNFSGNAGTNNHLSIASTGAATFSSTIVSNDYVQIIKASNPSLYINNTSVQWQTYVKSNSNIAFSDAVRDVLTLGYNGSATFFQGCNVGIGTASPGRQLEIYNANDAYMKFNGVRAGNHAFTVGNDSDGFIVYDETSAAYRLRIANSTGAATFSSSVTASGVKSQFIAEGGSGSGAGIALNTGLTGTDRRNWFVGTEENVAGDFVIKCSTAAGGSGNSGNTRIAILNNGNVGIGTTSPTALLNTYSATTATQIIVTGADTTNQRLEVTDGTVTNRFGIFGRTNGDAGIIGTQTNHPLVFNTNNTERMRITSGGDVGIGTSSPLQTAASRTVATINGTSSVILNIGIAGTLVSYWYAAVGSSTFETVGTNIISASGANAIQLNTNGSTRLTIASTGAATFSESVNIGNSAGVGKVQIWGVDQSSANYAQVNYDSQGNAGFLVRNDGLVAFPRINNFTTGNSPNTWINPASSYGIYINTSSRRYKKEISNYDKGINIVNQLRPVYYKGISEVDGDKQFVGLIAEEIHDLGLTEFVNYNEEGLPNSLSYPNMIALAFKAIQEQQAQIEALKLLIK